MGSVQDVKCHNCGAPLSLKAGEVIITCEFCGTAFNVASGKDFFLEHSILPSSVDDKKIDEIVRRWMGDGPLKPSNLQKSSKITDRALVFLPFYIVHIKVDTSYQGHYSRSGGREERSGHLKREYFWKVLGRRGSKFPTKEYEIPLSGKETFNLSKIPYGAKYLNAEIDENDSRDLTMNEVQDHQRFLIEEQVNEIGSISHKFDVDEIEFVHAPVWRVDYSYNGSSYQILVCSNTGNVIRGDIPPPDLSVGGFFSDMKRAFLGKRK